MPEITSASQAASSAPSTSAPSSSPDIASVPATSGSVIGTHTLETDALVIGAGPAGLFSVFQLGLQGLRCQVVDALPQAGGQCIELYADKPIYDIPAIRRCTGRELTEHLLRQIEPFDAGFHFSQEVERLTVRDDGRFELSTDAGTQFLAKAVVIASGVGAFQPRTLKVEGLAAYKNTQLFHHADKAEHLVDRRLLIAGDGDSALEAAIHFAQAQQAARASASTAKATAAAQRASPSVTLIHRREAFNAAPATIARMQALREAGALQFIAGQIIGIEETDEASGRHLSGAVILDSSGQTSTLPVDAVLVLMGLSPRLGPIADWGLPLERKLLSVDPERFETSVPGIHAVGDANTYPGKRRLILCGFHEATLAAFAVAARAFPEQPVLLQYTTTSPKLHRLLGVAPDVPSA